MPARDPRRPDIPDPASSSPATIGSGEKAGGANAEGKNAAAESATEALQRLEPYVAPENRARVEMIVEETIGEVVHHSGPLPRAADLASYNDIDPTFAERIVQMAEREQRHRHSLPTEIMSRDYAVKSRGQHYALVLASIIILFAGYLAWLGDTDMAGKVVICTLAGIVGIFVGGRLSEAIERRKDETGSGEG